MDIQNVVDTIVANVTVDGNVNVDALNEIIKGLRDVSSAEKKLAKEKAKDAQAEERAKTGEVAKAYYDSLAVGDIFFYKNSAGDVIEARKIETKSKTGATAAGELVNPPANAKTTKRYPKFYQLVLPEAAEETSDEEAIA